MTYRKDITNFTPKNAFNDQKWGQYSKKSRKIFRHNLEKHVLSKFSLIRMKTVADK